MIWGQLARVTTLLITYAIKLVGLAAAFDQLLLKPHTDSISLVVAAFMMAGAQVSEGLVLAAIDRLMTASEAAAPEKGPKP